MPLVRTIACVLLLSLLASPAAAQGVRNNAGLQGQLRWVQFRVANGRIVASSQRFVGRGMSTRSQQDGRQESLSVQLTPQGAQIKYELITDREHTTINFHGQGELHIRRAAVDAADVVPLEFVQQPGRQLRLAVGTGDQARTLAGPTLWHLLLSDRQLMTAEFAPLLELLVGDFDLAAWGERLDKSLRLAAREDRAESLRQWQALVDELSSQRYAERTAAERRLRTAGAALAPFLKTMDKSRLDAEQRWRLRRLAVALESKAGEDTPESVAPWLAWDKSAWLLVLTHESESMRRLAGEQLASLAGRPVRFDPAAPAIERAAQVEALRAEHLPAGSQMPLPDAGELELESP